MALIKCPECRKKISDQCGKCPNCGYPIETKDTIVETQNDETIKKDVTAETEEAPKTGRKPINKKLLAIIIAVIIILLTLGGILGYKALLPRINATKDFKAAVKFVEQKNSELEIEISESEELIAKKQPVLDETVVSALENAVSSTKAVKITDFKKPKKVEDIISRTEELSKTDYSEAIANLNDNHTALEISAKRYQLVNVPTEAYVIQCLQTIPEITGISAVTEDNDPNGNLNKAGGYTATVYFSHQSVNQNDVYGDTLIEKGTDAGGGIEVYTCVEDAEKRRDYLAAFDGGILASGTHTVVGTVLVRTSNELTATQQKDLETKIISVLTYLEEVDGKKAPMSEETINESKPIDNTSSSQHTTSEPTTSTNSNKYIAAITVAQSCYNSNTFITPAEIRNHMSEYGYSNEEINYAIENSDIDWNDSIRQHIYAYKYETTICLATCNYCGVKYYGTEVCPIDETHGIVLWNWLPARTRAEVKSLLHSDGYKQENIDAVLSEYPYGDFIEEMDLGDYVIVE